MILFLVQARVGFVVKAPGRLVPSRRLRIAHDVLDLVGILLHLKDEVGGLGDLALESTHPTWDLVIKLLSIRPDQILEASLPLILNDSLSHLLLHLSLFLCVLEILLEITLLLC